MKRTLYGHTGHKAHGSGVGHNAPVCGSGHIEDGHAPSTGHVSGHRTPAGH